MVPSATLAASRSKFNIPAADSKSPTPYGPPACDAIPLKVSDYATSIRSAINPPPEKPEMVV